MAGPFRCILAGGRDAVPRFHVYIAASLDGRIADGDGSVAWLEPYPGEAYGYEAFIADIGTVVMGRTSYEQALAFGAWPYPAQRSIVLTHRPARAPEGAEVEFRAGDVAELAEALALEPRDIWIMGGGDVIRQFLDAGWVDVLEVFVVPVLLGAGPPLFPDGASHGLELVSAEALAGGVVRLVYTPAPG
jgi:dihydrofolate reductase